jgi:hypothetical protein
MSLLVEVLRVWANPKYGLEYKLGLSIEKTLFPNTYHKGYGKKMPSLGLLPIHPYFIERD